MPLNPDVLLNLDLPPVAQELNARDIMLYALGIGLGADPMDTRQLRFVYEDGLLALPTMAIVLASGSPITARPEMGITRTHVVHGEQGFTLDRPLPVQGTILGQTRVKGVVDKGKDRGALLFTETTLTTKESGERVGVLTSTTFCRADGGFGGASGPVPPVHALPSTPPQFTCDLPTLPQAALIYRLSGDYNPLHADPAFAQRGGFDRPILHGRCTFGVAGHAILATLCDYDPARLVAMQGRFSAPVFPGETIRTEMWQAGEMVSFRATVPARNVVVINNGLARVRRV